MLTPIKKILPNVVLSHGFTQELLVRRVLEEAARVIRAIWGQERAVWIEPISFCDGVLTVKASSAAAKQQLHVDAIRIMNEINRTLEKRFVREIRGRSNGF